MNLNMNKCDVIIPVYNAPEWVKLCIYALIQNTPKEYLNKIYLLDDNSGNYTKNCLNNLKQKYSSMIQIETNKQNLGFVKNVNKGLKLSIKDKNADCILLLNTDCLVSKNTIPKLMAHIEKDNNIGLICPISSNAANLTLEMFEGFSYTQMDELLEKKFSGMSFDACTVVGNCLMITKKCIEKVGFLDEIYGMGYGEETDYHFKTLDKGLKAKVAIDTYVFHKAEVSFGTSKLKQERLSKNRKIFFNRWGKEYDKCYQQYKKNDPVEYIKRNITENDKKITVSTLFYLPDIHQNAGGCHMVSDMINYMVINGYSANILYHNIVNYKEIMVFNPIHIKMIDHVEVNQIVSTIWASVYPAYQIALDKKIPLINFVQGYEPYFENANIYGLVELSYKLSDSILTISNYLSNKLKNIFGYSSKIIPNAIHYDLLHHVNVNKEVRTITLILRGSDMKGDFILMDLAKLINNRCKNLTLNIVHMNPYIEFPIFSNSAIDVNLIKGPLERAKIHELLQQSDIYVDASINEGFGLTALEAMAAGCVPVTSNSFGILEYMNDSKNGFIINEVNDVEKYYSKIKELLEDKELLKNMREEGRKTSQFYDYDNNVEKYIKYFESIDNSFICEKNITEQEDSIIRIRTLANKKDSKAKKIAYRMNRIIPKSIKEKIKKIITSLYNLYQH